MCLYPWIFDPIRSGQTVEKSVDWIMDMDMDKIRFFLNGYGFGRIRSETRIRFDSNVRISDPIKLYPI